MIKHGISFTERWTNGKNQGNTRTLSTSIHQLLARPRERVLTICRIRIHNGHLPTFKMTPFWANYGINLEHPLITQMMTDKITLATGMEELHDTLTAQIAIVQLRHRENYDRHRKPDPDLES